MHDGVLSFGRFDGVIHPFYHKKRAYGKEQKNDNGCEFF
jgi:hypothetical protein